MKIKIIAAKVSIYNIKKVILVGFIKKREKNGRSKYNYWISFHHNYDWSDWISDL